MLNVEIVQNAYLYVLPSKAKGRGGKGRKNKVYEEQPIREIVPTARIESSEDVRLQPAAGRVYTAYFSKGEPREIFVPAGNMGLHFHLASFLRSGRKGTLLRDIWEVKIKKPEDADKALLARCIKKMEHDAKAQNVAIMYDNG